MINSAKIHVLQDQGELGVRVATYDLVTGSKLRESVKLDLADAWATRRITFSKNREILEVHKFDDTAASGFPGIVYDHPPQEVIALLDVRSGERVFSWIVNPRQLELPANGNWMQDSIVRWYVWLHRDPPQRAGLQVFIAEKSEFADWSLSSMALTATEAAVRERNLVREEQAVERAAAMGWEEYSFYEGLVPVQQGFFGLDVWSTWRSAMDPSNQTIVRLLRSGEGTIEAFYGERRVELDLNLEPWGRGLQVTFLKVRGEYLTVTLGERTSRAYRTENELTQLSTTRARRIRVYSLETGELLFDEPGVAALIDS
ncbi:MAG: hypothetical protein IH944_13160 [Armatimonadetes bacterium]|nr:hypothetical protein [Armatimonadota bacterium]